MFFCGKKPYKNSQQNCSICIFWWSSFPWSQSPPSLAEPRAALQTELGNSLACAASQDLVAESPLLGPAGNCREYPPIHEGLGENGEKTGLPSPLLCQVSALGEPLPAATRAG